MIDMDVQANGSRGTTALQVEPTILIGLAGAGKLFDESVLLAVAKACERPIIMPMVSALLGHAPPLTLALARNETARQQWH